MKLLFLLLMPFCAFAQNPTARELVARIQKQTGVTLPASAVDTFKAGNPDAPVKGVAVTMMATYDVLERAAEAGDNLVITHEPTFFNHLDETAELAGHRDPVLAAKQQFIRDHGLIIWRFHDGWHARQPDGILEGMVDALHWQAYQQAAERNLFTMPGTTLDQLAGSIRSKLAIRVMRVVGNPKLQVTKVAFLPGAVGSDRQIAMLEREDVEALVIGETREWETVEYVADAARQGRRKALIILGHVVSEQAGMQNCARWLQTFLSGVPIHFIPTREPFWRP